MSDHAASSGITAQDVCPAAEHFDNARLPYRWVPGLEVRRLPEAYYHTAPWIEVSHTFDWTPGPLWLYAAPGSGTWWNPGSRVVSRNMVSAVLLWKPPEQVAAAIQAQERDNPDYLHWRLAYGETPWLEILRRAAAGEPPFDLFAMAGELLAPLLTPPAGVDSLLLLQQMHYWPRWWDEAHDRSRYGYAPRLLLDGARGAGLASSVAARVHRVPEIVDFRVQVRSMPSHSPSRAAAQRARPWPTSRGGGWAWPAAHAVLTPTPAVRRVLTSRAPSGSGACCAETRPGGPRARCAAPGPAMIERRGCPRSVGQPRHTCPDVPVTPCCYSPDRVTPARWSSRAPRARAALAARASCTCSASAPSERGTPPARSSSARSSARTRAAAASNGRPTARLAAAAAGLTPFQRASCGECATRPTASARRGRPSGATAPGARRAGRRRQEAEGSGAAGGGNNGGGNAGGSGDFVRATSDEFL